MVPHKLSGRPPVQIRRNLRLEEQACLLACRLKLSLLRQEHNLPSARSWPAIPGLAASVARGYATDNEVAQLMVLVATGRARSIGDDLWRQRATELYALQLGTAQRTSA